MSANLHHYIEDTLLLPLSEIEKYLVPMFSGKDPRGFQNPWGLVTELTPS
ncbi:MAG: hypothetical protein ACFCVD_14915 [Nodosilinea sp.]